MSEIESQNRHDPVSNNIRFNCYENNGSVKNIPEAPTKGTAEQGRLGEP